MKELLGYLLTADLFLSGALLRQYLYDTVRFKTLKIGT